MALTQRDGDLSADATAAAVASFKALSDGTRLAALHMLASGELCACKLLEGFQITQPTLSYHMNILCAAGLVNARRDGAWVHYSLNRKALRSIMEQLNTIVGDDDTCRR